MVLNT